MSLATLWSYMEINTKITSECISEISNGDHFMRPVWIKLIWIPAVSCFSPPTQTRIAYSRSSACLWVCPIGDVILRLRGVVRDFDSSWWQQSLKFGQVPLITGLLISGQDVNPKICFYAQRYTTTIFCHYCLQYGKSAWGWKAWQGPETQHLHFSRLPVDLSILLLNLGGCWTRVPNCKSPNQ